MPKYKKLIFLHKNKEFLVTYKTDLKGYFVDYDTPIDPEQRVFICIKDVTDTVDFTKIFNEIAHLEEKLGLNTIIDEINEEIYLDD